MYIFILNDCIIERYYPITMSYNNKYLFSKKTEDIRKFKSIDLIVDGEMMGMGGPAPEKKWYQKKYN